MYVTVLAWDEQALICLTSNDSSHDAALKVVKAIFWPISSRQSKEDAFNRVIKRLQGDLKYIDPLENEIGRRYYDVNPAHMPIVDWIFYPWGTSIQEDGMKYDREPHLAKRGRRWSWFIFTDRDMYTNSLCIYFFPHAAFTRTAHANAAARLEFCQIFNG